MQGTDVITGFHGSLTVNGVKVALVNNVTIKLNTHCFAFVSEPYDYLFWARYYRWLDAWDPI